MRLPMRVPHSMAASGNRPDAREALVLHEPADRRAHVVRALHAHETVDAVARPCPPRTAVALRVGGRGGIHVPAHRGHLVLAVDASDVDEACLGEERADVLVAVVEREGLREVGPAEVDVARDVRRSLVDRATQQHPPVEEVLEAPVELERAAREPRHGGRLIAPEVGELLRRQPQPQALARSTVEQGHRTAVARHMPRVAVDIDGERALRVVQGGPQQIGGRFERRGDGVTCGRGFESLDFTVDPGPYVQGHDHIIPHVPPLLPSCGQHDSRAGPCRDELGPDCGSMQAPDLWINKSGDSRWICGNAG